MNFATIRFLCGFSVSIVVLCCECNGGSAAAFLPEIKVPSEVSVAGSKITLETLLTPEVKNPELVEQLRVAFVAWSPAPGKTAVLSKAEVLRRMEIVGITTERYAFKIPEEIRIKRQAQTLTASDLVTRVIHDFLPRLPWKEVELEKIDVLESVQLPVGKTSLVFEIPLRTDFARPFYLQVNFVVDGEVVRRSFIRTALIIHHTVAVATKELKPTHKINSSDIRWEKQRLLTTLHVPIENLESIENKCPRIAIAAGRILVEDLFIAVPLIKRGESVSLLFQDQKMRITTQGKSLTSGLKGDHIRVMNSDSGKVLLAEVVDEKTAKVIF